ncbi:hypothetical protein R5R35_013252 [Gryllus longicercus]|uniref:Uncharacterized protein n=1 Tax=Gryllus longicercus TaxID=2509291 RepID=A0AAN9ZI06_9ORTH
MGYTPLLIATHHARSSIVICLLENGANVNKADINGDIPLLVAVINQKRDFVQMLLREGASPTKKNKKGESPLYVTARDGHEDILELLLEVVQKSESAEIGRSLRVAASAEVVWILADAGRDVVLGEAGMEALVASAADGRQETLHALLQLGVDANATYAIDGWTVLHVAAWRGYTSCLHMLLKAGALVNVKDEFGQTALHVAADIGKSECVVVLPESGADANLLGKDGYTAVDLARQNNHQDCVLEIERRLV